MKNKTSGTFAPGLSFLTNRCPRDRATGNLFIFVPSFFLLCRLAGASSHGLSDQKAMVSQHPPQKSPPSVWASVLERAPSVVLTLPELAAGADAIVIVRISGTEVAAGVSPPRIFDTGMTDPVTRRPVGFLAASFVATASVETVLKGNLVAKTPVRIAFPARDSGEGATANVVPLTRLHPGERALVFLRASVQNGKRAKGKTDWALYAPEAASGPVILLTSDTPNSRASAPTVAGQASSPCHPLRQVVQVLIQQLAADPPAVAGDAPGEILERLRSLRFLFYGPPAISTRRALGEPGEAREASELEGAQTVSGLPASPKETLESFLEAQVVPDVLRIANQTEAKTVRFAALLTAGALRSPEALEALAAIADDETQDSDRRRQSLETLGAARSVAALPVLVCLLESPEVRLREAAASALREIACPAAVPGLVRHLGETDRDVRYLIVAALYASSDREGMPSVAAFQAKEQEYLATWKSMASSTGAAEDTGTFPAAPVVVNGLQLTVKIVPPEGPKGQPVTPGAEIDGRALIWLEVAVQNVGKTTRVYSDILPDADFEVDIQEAHGTPVPRTRYGQIKADSSFVLSEKIITLAPGQGRTYRFPLSRMFDLSLQGTYQVTARHPFSLVGGISPKTAVAAPAVFTVGYPAPVYGYSYGETSNGAR